MQGACLRAGIGAAVRQTRVNQRKHTMFSWIAWQQRIALCKSFRAAGRNYRTRKTHLIRLLPPGPLSFEKFLHFVGRNRVIVIRIDLCPVTSGGGTGCRGCGGGRGYSWSTPPPDASASRF
jgi:hypothetical protein